MSDLWARIASLPPERAELLARVLREQGIAKPAPPLIKAVRADATFPLSFFQQSLWFFDQFQPGSSAFNITRAIRWRGPLDLTALRLAIESVTQRHEVLRISFRSVEGKPVQVVNKAVPIALELIDLPVLNQGGDERFTELLTIESRKPFHLSCDPLFRVSVGKISEQDHIILFVMHHICTDAWSSSILVREVASFYRANVSGEKAEMPYLSIQYTDYSAWQREWLQGEALEYQLEFWRRKLTGSLPRLELPTDRAAPAVQTFNGNHIGVTLPGALGRALNSLATRHQSTPFMVFLAAWTVLLHRYTRESDIIVGTPFANRDRDEVKNMVGYFVNPISLRIDASGNPSFLDLLGRVRDISIEAFSHGEIPFDLIVDSLGGNRDASHPPLFQTALLVQNAPTEQLDLPDVQLSTLRIESGSSKVDLTLAVTELGHSLLLSLEYNTDLFDFSTAERILRHYSRLLQSISQNPQVRINGLQYIEQDEAATLTQHWSTGGALIRGGVPATLLELWQHQVRENGWRTALESGDIHWSYSQLDERANRLGRYLTRMGVGPESIVGICCARGAELVLGLLGTWKAGAAYMVLDEKYPAERWRLMLEDAKVPIVLCTSDMAFRLMMASGDTPLLTLDAQWDEISLESADAPLCPREPEGIAYVVYTSGSSGTPRGVIVRDSSLANLTEAMIEVYALGPGHRRLQFVSPGFDAFAEEVFPLLFSGGTLIIGHPASGLDPAELVQLIRREKISVLHMPPSYWHELVSDLERRRAKVPEELKLLVVGAESPSPEQLTKWARCSSSGSRWINAYGPAEGTITATAWEAPLDDIQTLLSLRRVPVGRPIANTAVYVLDAEMEPVATGVTGDLYIGGAGLARGYLNRPDLTAERFVPNLFNNAGGRLYRTGDLARYLPDGVIQFLGRKDHQVKVRGYRIELEEVEAVLRKHGGIREVLVDVREVSSQDQRLTAYIVPAPGPSFTSAELRSWLKQRLPEYMLPSAWVYLTELPRTAHGKVDRKALPLPQIEDSTQRNLEQPRSDAERTLARIWCDVLRRENIGLHDNFFELGGDSILSIQIAARAQSVGLRITVKQLFQYQTVAELASVVQSASLEQAAEQGRVTGNVELTPIQRWFFEQDLKEPWHFNQAVLLQATEPISEEGLRLVVGTLVEHHDALRTRFTRQGDKWLQQVATDNSRDPLAVEEVLSSEELQRRAGHWQKQFDLSSGLLLRVVLFRMAAEADRVLLIAHHLVVDGVSWRILLTDLELAYQQWRSGETIRLPEKTISFQRWADLLKTRAASNAVQAEGEYWQEQCVTASRTVGGGQRTASVQVALDESDTRALLQEVPAVYGTQINDALLTALVEALGTDGELTVELEGHGRDEALELDVSRTVGWFTTQYPVRLGWIGAKETPDKFKTVKEQLRQVPGKGLGYGLLRYFDASGKDRRSLERHASVSFNYLGQLDSILRADGLFLPAREDKGATRSASSHSPYPVMVNCQVMGGRLHAAFTYREPTYSRPEIESACGRFLDTLRAIVEHCKLPNVGGYTPSDFPLANLTRSKLEQWFKGGRTIEDVYPLSPMQQGLLFHALLDPSAGAYLLQIRWDLSGLDLNAFAQAWQGVVDRHAILRTSFMWDGLEEPIQLVHKHCEVLIEREDWTIVGPAERDRLKSEIFATQRSQAFDFSKPPLMRLRAIQIDVNTYRVIWAFHHLLMDGWSGANLMNEVFALYVAQISGKRADLPRPFLYRDYIQWLQNADLAGAEQYWRQELAGFDTPTPLGMERPSLLASDEVGERVAVERSKLSTELSTALHDFARSSGVTLNTIFQGAWALALSWHSAESDVLFGATTAGRPPELPGIEGAIGLFINTLPVRVRIPLDTPVVEWLKELQSNQSRARDWEHTPLLKIQSWSEAPRGKALFESLLVFERYPTDSTVGENRPTVGVSNPVAEERTHYPLTFEVVPSANILLRLAHERRRFDGLVIAQVLGSIERFLSELVADPQLRIGSLKWLSDEQERSLIERNISETKPVPANRLFHELFEEQVDKTPQRTAIRFEQANSTYRELNCRANHVARHLVQRGVGPESIVTVLADHGTAFVVAVLGIFKAGAAYLPLEPSIPPSRFEQIVTQSGCVCVLVTRSMRDFVANASLRVPALELEEVANSSETAENLPPFGRSSNLAYVIYTSGSTGTPKGAMVEQAGMLNHLFCKVGDLGLQESDVIAQTAAHTFDISVWQYLAPLLVGGCVQVYSPEVAQDPVELWRRVKQDGVTILESVPPLIRSMLQVNRSRDEANQLRWLVATGESLPSDVALEWLNLHPNTALMNAYGPTECSDDVTHAFIRGGSPNSPINIPIGLPIANLRAYILDSSLRLVPDGAVGELCIAGIGVGRGYFGDPSRTSEVFVPDPFDPSGGRLYRTGDLGRHGPDGEIEFLRRKDQQVKVRGYRIELGEIETALRSHPDVADAVVLVDRSDSVGRLVAYITGTQDVSAMRSSLLRRLPDYMLPSAFVCLEAMPLLSSGKIDRRALSLNRAQVADLPRQISLPHSAVEKILADIWMQLLRARDVGIRDNFFELGGHSLTATQLVSRIRETLNIDLPLRAVFENPTIESLSEILSSDPEQRQRLERTAELILQVSDMSDDQLEAVMLSGD